MKLRNAVVVSILVVLGIACAGAVTALYTDVSVKASAPDYAAGLGSIPSNYQFVFGINVQKFAQSPAYAKFQQNNPMGNDLAVFVEKTGLNPMRDISYLVGAGNSREKSGDKGIVIVSGRFSKEAIVSYIRSKSSVIEEPYGGTSVMMFPEPQSDAVKKGLAFVNDQEIALGDLESLKAVLDIRGQESKSILSNETMAPLIRSIGPDEMFWFAGDAAGVLAKTPATAPLAASAATIKSIVGTVNIGDALTGKITATAFSSEEALKLADAIRGLIALGQLAANRNPELKALFGGLAVSQNSAQVSVDLNFPADLLAKMQQSSQAATTVSLSASQLVSDQQEDRGRKAEFDPDAAIPTRISLLPTGD